MFTGSSTFTDPSAVLGSQSVLKLSSTGPESLNLLSNSSTFLDNQSTNFSSNQLPIENYSYPVTVNGGFASNITTTASVPLEPSGGGGGLVGDIIRNANQSLSNQNQNHIQKSGLYSGSKQDYIQYSHNAFSTLASSALATGGGGGGGGLGGLVSHSRSNGGGGGGSTLTQTEKLSMGSNEDFPFDQTKLQGGFVANNGYGSLDDLMTGMMKRVQSFLLFFVETISSLMSRLSCHGKHSK